MPAVPLTALLLALAPVPASALDQSGAPAFGLTGKPPVFQVWSEQGDAGAVRFSLQRTSVDARVANGVVQARVSQAYRNDGQGCLQSRYVFPLPHRAAIAAMSMTIGNRTVVGVIRTRSKAREEFEAAKDAGKSASLLNQERPNVFSMELANILPGDTVRVDVDYVETLVPVDGIFAFTFPTVVGPRYGQDWESGSVSPNLSANASNTLTVDAQLTVRPRCLGLQSDLQIQKSNTSTSSLATLTGTTADIIVKFWFTERAVGAQLLVSRVGSERYFSLAVQPPQRRLLDSQQVSKREYIFILDTSGSMTGKPLDLSKGLMRKLLKENVRDGDFLNIMCFAGGSRVLSPQESMKATPENVDQAQSWLDANMVAGGGTELLPALERAFGLPRSGEATARTIIVMTDGYVSVEREAFDLVRSKLGDGSVFVFGIGSSVSRYLIEGLARVGYGEPFVVTDMDQGDAMVAKLQRYVDTPVLTRLTLGFDGDFQPSEQEPPLLPDVFASRPVQVVGKWSGGLSGQARLQGRLADGSSWEYVADIGQVDLADVPAVRLLWARSRIATLSDYAVLGSSDSTEAEITALGLKYSLMTEYTAFVAVDSHPSGPQVCGLAGNTSNKTAEGKGPPKLADDKSMMVKTMGSPTSEAAGGGSQLRCTGALLLLLLLLSFQAMALPDPAS